MILLKLCPRSYASGRKTHEFTDSEWYWVIFLHLIYMKSPEAILSGVKCDC